jgi:dihydrofolate reductase
MKITLYMALSANGLISNARNIPYWLSKEYGQGFMEVCTRTQAVIMGRSTYDILAPDYLPLRDQGTLAVLTHNKTLRSDNTAVLFTDAGPAAVIDMLAERGHKEAVIIGGAEMATAFMQAGLVNEIILVVEPVVFGSGLPLFKGSEFEYKLSLTDVEKLNDHTVQLHYAVIG